MVVVDIRAGVAVSVTGHVQTNTGLAQVRKDLGGVLDADKFDGADILAKIQAAYASLPAGGGTILVRPNPSGGCWTATTSIVLNTVGKTVVIRGTVPSGRTTGDIPTGTCINFTPVTAVTAITLDFAPSAGGGFAPGGGISDLLITNTLATDNTAAPPAYSTSATGVACGATNGGAPSAKFSNLQIQGFHVGFSCGNGQSWGMQFDNLSVRNNNTGFTTTAPNEGLVITGGVAGFNGTAFSFNQTAAKLVGVHIDSNTVMGISCTAGTLTTVGLHFENLGPTTTHYLNGSCNWSNFGGEALDDGTTSNADYWFLTTGLINIEGMAISSGGRTVTNLIVVSGLARLSFLNSSPATLTPCPTFATSSVCSTIAAADTPFINAPKVGLGTSAGTYDLVATAGSTGTGTFPNATGTVVLDTYGQKLSNKTLASPVFTGNTVESTANGATWTHGSISEEIALSTSGTTTDSSADLLPANSIIEVVVARVLQTIDVVTDWKLGDVTTAGRFTAAQSKGQLTAGATVVGLVHADQTGASGPIQASAAKLRITCTGAGGKPTQGRIRVTVFYRSFAPPAS
jgi:hypothetical protein